MDDKAITALFFERAPEALTETQKKCGPLCRSAALDSLLARQRKKRDGRTVQLP